MSKVNDKKTKREKDLTVSVTPDANTKKEITDIESLMDKIEDYSEYLGIKGKHNIKDSMINKKLLHDFSSNVNSYVIKTIELSPHKTILKELNDFLQIFPPDKNSDIKNKKGLGGIEPLKKLVKDYDNMISISYNNENIKNNMSKIEGVFESLLLLFDMHMKFKYKDKKIYQEDIFEQYAVIIKLLYAWLMGVRNTILQDVLKRDLDTVKGVWALTYEIGLLQGKICLIESLLDQDLLEIHRSRKSSKDITKDWKGRYKNKAEKDEQLDQLLREPLKYAEEVWEKSHRKIYHDEMANILFEKYKHLHIDRETYKEKLKPIARRYHYSTFSRGEFKSQKDITILCQAIMADNNCLELKSPEYTIAWLNEMMEDIDMNFSSLKDHVKESGSFNNICDDINNNADSLFTQDAQKLGMYWMMKNNLVKTIHLKYLNLLDLAPPKEDMNELLKIYSKRYMRLFWERAYPSITPKSLPHGLMRGWAGKKKEE